MKKKIGHFRIKESGKEYCTLGVIASVQARAFNGGRDVWKDGVPVKKSLLLTIQKLVDGAWVDFSRRADGYWVEG